MTDLPRLVLPPGAREKWGNARFLISRGDNLGDVVLTLPLAGILRAAFPECRIGFLGKPYTRALIGACPWVDAFVDAGEFLKTDYRESWTVLIHVFPRRDLAVRGRALGIPVRIGTRNRWFHWLTCNRLPAVSRRHSSLHESQLNLALLAPVIGPQSLSTQEIGRFLSLARHEEMLPATRAWLVPGKKAVVLHPGSRGSAREWGYDRFGELMELLRPRKDVQLYVTGTAPEGEQMKEWLSEFPEVVSLCGKLSLGQLTAFLAACHGLVAASTGPLHIASALGIRAVGLYVPPAPLFPTRWAPIGPDSVALVRPEPCAGCVPGHSCACIRSLSPALVAASLNLSEPSPSPEDFPA